jgi:nucleoside-diphosphate-sugar epimerase
MQIVGKGFLARNLSEGLGDRYPTVTAIAAGVSSQSVTATADFDREANLLYDVLAECRDRRRTLLFFSTASFAMYGAASVPALESGPVCPPAVYGRHKLALESCIRSAGVDFLILRLSHLVGPYQRVHQLLPSVVAQIRAGAVTVYQGAHRDLLDVQDLVYVIDRLLDTGTRDEVINVVSGVPQPVDNIIDGIERRLGANVERRYVPGEVLMTRASKERLEELVPNFGAERIPPNYLDQMLDRYLPHYAD